MGRRRSVMSESFKYELAKDLGFYDVVQKEGWEGIRTKDAGNMVKRAIQIAEEHLAKQQSPGVQPGGRQAYHQPVYGGAAYNGSESNQTLSGLQAGGSVPQAYQGSQTASTVPQTAYGVPATVAMTQAPSGYASAGPAPYQGYSQGYGQPYAAGQVSAGQAHDAVERALTQRPQVPPSYYSEMQQNAQTGQRSYQD